MGNNSKAGGTFNNSGNTAIGAGAQAGTTAGGQTNATAVGRQAKANAANATALGQGSNASASSSMALGFNSSATAANSVAIGSGSVANQANTVSVGSAGNERRITNVAAAVNDTDATNLAQVNSLIHDMGAVWIGIGSSAVDTGAAVGDFAQATQEGAAAYGYHAEATGFQSTSIGAHSQASGRNSTAIGTGAVATLDNQVAVGSASSTYTMAGLTSGQSKARQSGPIEIVTSDGGGNLATANSKQLGLATQSQVSGLSSRIDALGQRDNQLTEGIATVASLAQPIFLPGQRFSMSAAWGGYESANAVGFSAAGVVAQNLLRPGSGALVLFGGVGVGAEEGEMAGRAGVSFGW